VNRVKDDVMGVPETGTALVEYKITGRNMSNRDGKTKYGMDVEIRSFDPQAGAKAKAKESKPGAAKAVMLERLDGALTELARGDQALKLVHGGKPPADLLKHYRIPQRQQSTWKGNTPGSHPIPSSRHVANTIRDIRSTKKAEKEWHKSSPSKTPHIGWGLERLKGKERAQLDKQLKGTGFSEFSDRSRDNDGQFVGAATGGADPVTMRQAYGKKALVAGAGAAALAGAGMLVGTRGGRKLVSQGLKAAGGGLHKLRGAVVSKNSGGRGQGFMKSPSEKPGAGAYMQRRRMQGE
jgi:hypothetical protein